MRRRARVLLALVVALLLAATDTFVVTTDAAAARRCRLAVVSAAQVGGDLGRGVNSFTLVNIGGDEVAGTEVETFARAEI